jgi:hypothetical protein
VFEAATAKALEVSVAEHPSSTSIADEDILTANVLSFTMTARSSEVKSGEAVAEDENEPIQLTKVNYDTQGLDSVLEANLRSREQERSVFLTATLIRLHCLEQQCLFVVFALFQAFCVH